MNKEKPSSVFGPHPFPYLFRSDEIEIVIGEKGGLFHYERTCCGRRLDKIIADTEGTIVINPVEPVKLPREVTAFLEVHFPAVLVGPGSEKAFFLTFPIEIGVFLKGRDDYSLLDVFSTVPQKYSLYGPPDGGVITRYHESTIQTTVPAVDPLRDGVLGLVFRNQSRDWIEVSRVVLDSAGMVVYYGPFTSISAEIDLFSGMVAETRVVRRPLDERQQPGVAASSAKKVRIAAMVESIPLYSAGKALVVEKKGYLMEYGLGDSLEHN